MGSNRCCRFGKGIIDTMSDLNPSTKINKIRFFFIIFLFDLFNDSSTLLLLLMLLSSVVPEEDDDDDDDDEHASEMDRWASVRNRLDQDSSSLMVGRLPGSTCLLQSEILGGGSCCRCCFILLVRWSFWDRVGLGICSSSRRCGAAVPSHGEAIQLAPDKTKKKAILTTSGWL